MYPTDLTVAAVVFYDGRYLMVEEPEMGRIRLNQPGGHIESGESPESAAVREVARETGYDIRCEDLIGVYLWIHPQTRQQFLRIVYAAELIDGEIELGFRDNVATCKWLTLRDLEGRTELLRSPVTLKCVRDFESGRRESDALFAGMLPLQQHVHAVLARADLV